MEIGEALSPALRVVDLWAADTLLTTDDNVAFVPAFRRLLRDTAEQVRRRAIPPCPFPGRPAEEVFRLLAADQTEFRERYWFLRWGETVDNLSSYAYLDDALVLVFAFWRSDPAGREDRGRVFSATICPDEFTATLDAAVDLLEAKTAGRR
ncbi:hypothetical protein GA0070622_4202 [Micromonospora sediminicola]|uniref:Uncharacterized protein n=1 Tax=Micromonospora sediminicola TaxID=946078 RepID=A0A1A9BDV9_9ACTN|nr:hypothetical protein GA0070622_4202 [Micromonospora sediminicola]